MVGNILNCLNENCLIGWKLFKTDENGLRWFKIFFNGIEWLKTVEN